MMVTGLDLIYGGTVGHDTLEPLPRRRYTYTLMSSLEILHA